MNILLNAAAFQGLWFVLVLSGARGLDVVGLLAVAAWLPIHLHLSQTAMADARLFAALLLVGPLVDAMALQAGFIAFRGQTLHPMWPPLWLAGLWGSFALTLRHSLRSVMQRPWLAVPLGAIGGPLAYVTGERLGAIELATPLWQPLAVLGAGWAVAMAVLCWAVRPHPKRVAATS